MESSLHMHPSLLSGLSASAHPPWHLRGLQILQLVQVITLSANEDSAFKHVFDIITNPEGIGGVPLLELPPLKPLFQLTRHHRSTLQSANAWGLQGDLGFVWGASKGRDTSNDPTPEMDPR